MFLDVEERKKRDGYYNAYVDGEFLLCAREPLLDGARLLLQRGVDPEVELIMRWKHSGTQSLRGKVGKLAKLDVRDGPDGLRLVPWDGPRKPPVGVGGALD
jgi:hypothetical protein